jgi:hypothetical protein
VVFCLFLLVVWMGARREDRMAVQRACHHSWVLESLYNEGRLWHRRCVRCGKQEPVGDSRAPMHRAPVRRPDGDETPR